MAEATIAGLDTDGGLWYEYEPAKNHLIKEKTLVGTGRSNGWFF